MFIILGSSENSVENRSTLIEQQTLISRQVFHLVVILFNAHLLHFSIYLHMSTVQMLVKTRFAAGEIRTVEAEIHLLLLDTQADAT